MTSERRAAEVELLKNADESDGDKSGTGMKEKCNP